MKVGGEVLQQQWNILQSMSLLNSTTLLRTCIQGAQETKNPSEFKPRTYS
jgi:hypothetical protein